MNRGACNKQFPAFLRRTLDGMAMAARQKSMPNNIANVEIASYMRRYFSLEH